MTALLEEIVVRVAMEEKLCPEVAAVEKEGDFDFKAEGVVGDEEERFRFCEGWDCLRLSCLMSGDSGNS